MPRRGSPYGPHYQRRRAALLARRLRCACGAPADSADHDPPIALHRVDHVEGSGCCRLVPSCVRCQCRQGGMIRAGHIRHTPTPSRLW